MKQLENALICVELDDQALVCVTIAYCLFVIFNGHCIMTLISGSHFGILLPTGGVGVPFCERLINLCGLCYSL
uniref:Uncharacterized protein n=1 Tax=Lotus japonicus TaxID=34305 RepID=I3SBP2_LOTJA|nr:unknown [Lotus japonicus]